MIVMQIACMRLMCVFLSWVVLFNVEYIIIGWIDNNMDWCMCPGNTEVEEAYQEEKMRRVKVERSTYPVKGEASTALSRGVSYHQLGTMGDSRVSVQSLRMRNMQIRQRLAERKQELWQRANNLERRS